MKIAIVSDVHGNMTGFEAVVDAVQKEGADLVVHGGDLAFNGPRPAEVVDRVRELGWPGVVGNTDDLLWGGDASIPRWLPQPEREAFRPMVAATAEMLGAERIEWLRRLPAEWRCDDLLLLHASPGDLWKAPRENPTDEDLASTYGGQRATTVVYGHTHMPFVRTLGDLTVANSGSAGWTLDGDNRLSYVVVEDGRPSVRRIEYDLERARREMSASRYPTRTWLTEVMRQAHWIFPVTLDT